MKQKERNIKWSGPLVAHSNVHLILRNLGARVLLHIRVLPKVIPRPSTTSSKVVPDLLHSSLGTTAGHIEIMVYSLLGPIKTVKRPRNSSHVEADHLNELLTEPRTVPILLIWHLIHLVAMVEHVDQLHGMNGCTGTLLTAPLSSESLMLRWRLLMLRLWLWLVYCL